MKKGTKKIIIRALLNEIRSLKSSIWSCKNTFADDDPHVLKLHRKVDELQKAILEVEAC